MGVTVVLLTAVSCFLGASLADQSSYPVSPHQSLTYPGQEASLGYPAQDTGLTEGAYYQNYPSAAEADQPDYGLQAGTNDRTLDVFTFPMVLTAFFSAMMGGLMAPMIVGVTRRMGEFEFDLPDLSKIKFPVKSKKSKKSNKNDDEGRSVEDNILRLVSLGFQKLLRNNQN